MIVLNFKCGTSEKRYDVLSQLHSALAGSPAYVNNEIALCEDGNDVQLVVGVPNSHDINLDVSVTE